MRMDQEACCISPGAGEQANEECPARTVLGHRQPQDHGADGRIRCQVCEITVQPDRGKCAPPLSVLNGFTEESGRRPESVHGGMDHDESKDPQERAGMVRNICYGNITSPRESAIFESKL